MASTREMINFGHQNLAKGDIDGAIRWYINAGDEGLAQGYYEAANQYNKDPKQSKNAEKYFLKAASQRYSPAYEKLYAFYTYDEEKSAHYSRLYKESRDPLSNSNGLFYPADLNNGNDCFGEPMIPAVLAVEKRRAEIKIELIHEYGEEQVELAEIYALKRWADYQPIGYAEESGALARILAKRGAVEEAQKYFDHYLNYIANPPEGMGFLSAEGSSEYSSRTLEISFLKQYASKIDIPTLEFKSEDSDKIFWYAQKLKEEKKPQEAWTYFAIAADKGHREALWYVCQTLMHAPEKEYLYGDFEIFRNNRETSFDFDAAEKYLVVLSEKNDLRATILLGRLYNRFKEEGDNLRKFQDIVKIIARQNENDLADLVLPDRGLTDALRIVYSYGNMPYQSLMLGIKALEILNPKKFSEYDPHYKECTEAHHHAERQLYTEEQIEDRDLEYAKNAAEHEYYEAVKAVEILERRKIYNEALNYAEIVRKHLVRLSEFSISDYAEDMNAIDLKISFFEEKIKGELSSSTSQPAENSAARVTQNKISPTAERTDSENMALENIGIKILELPAFLKKNIIGQDRAAETLSKHLVNVQAGLHDTENGVKGAFLFSGPTGVGKTETAKLLAKFLNMNLIRLDMSEYMERHDLSRLIGASPGYVGYGKEGTLTGAVRKNPHSVVLFDEVEKANPDIFNILLQVLDKGLLKDGSGNDIDFRNTLILMTTNAGQTNIRNGIGFGAGTNEDAPATAIAEFFTPEFIGRLDGIVEFKKLQPEHAASITKIFLEKASSTLSRNKSVTVSFDDSVVAIASKEGFNFSFGARPLEKYVQNHVMSILSEFIVSNEIKKGDSLTITFNAAKNAFEWKFKQEDPSSGPNPNSFEPR